MPFHRQFNLLLWCKVSLILTSPLWKMLLQNIMSYMRLGTKIVKSLVEVLYSFIEQARNSGRHDGGLASVKWKNCAPFVEKIEWNSDEPFFEKSVLTIFVLLWPLARNISAKLVYTRHVAIRANNSKSGRHDGGLVPFQWQFILLLWCKVILNSDEPIMKNVTSKHHVIHAAWDKNCEVSCWSIIFIHWAST